MKQEYDTVIGLEIHVELSTKSKIFCSCSTEFGKEPNTCICPVCTGMPGALPVLNRQVVEYAIAAGLALNCSIRSRTCFDRKNYFYPDNPQNYQISQLYLPICHDGFLELSSNQEMKRLRIREIHMEEDAGRMIYEKETKGSLIDYNRSGIPLLEIVTEPDFRSADEVIAFLEKLRILLRYTEVSDCRLQEGSMRVDVNLSLSDKTSGVPGTRTEMKNLNSFRAIRRAVQNEQERQAHLLRMGKSVTQETRRWDDGKGRSFSMRNKESAQDYRYFPEPDLPPVWISQEWITGIRESLPEFREQKATRFVRQYQLSEYDADLLTESRTVAALFEETAVLCHSAKAAANWLTGETFRLLRENSMDPEELRFSAIHLAELIRMLQSGAVSGPVAKKVFERIFLEDVDPKAYVREHHLETVQDTAALETAAVRVLAENASAAEQYRQGKEKVLGFLLGQLMRQMKGQADPSSASEILRRLLKS